jgi:hypothetical protein
MTSSAWLLGEAVRARLVDFPRTNDRIGGAKPSRAPTGERSKAGAQKISAHLHCAIDVALNLGIRMKSAKAQGNSLLILSGRPVLDRGGLQRERASARVEKSLPWP